MCSHSLASGFGFGSYQHTYDRKEEPVAAAKRNQHHAHSFGIGRVVCIYVCDKHMHQHRHTSVVCVWLLLWFVLRIEYLLSHLQY